jgi:hypothetical protein
MQICIAVCSIKPYTLAGFEPGFSVPEVDAISTILGSTIYQKVKGG